MLFPEMGDDFASYEHHLIEVDGQALAVLSVRPLTLSGISAYGTDQRRDANLSQIEALRPMRLHD